MLAVDFCRWKRIYFTFIRPIPKVFAILWKLLLMVTSRFVCGEISRLIKLLRVSRNAQSRDAIWRNHQGNTCRTYMNASSVFTRPLLFQLPPLSLRFFISRRHSHPFSLSSSSRSAFFLDVFALSAHEQKAIKKRRRNGDVSRAASEKRNLWPCVD